jgi:hypothetical protein
MLLQALFLARLLVLVDKARYDEIWEATHNDPAEYTAITALGKMVQELVTQSTVRPLQLNRLRSSAAAINGVTTLGGSSSNTFQRLRSAGGRLPLVLCRASSVVPLDAFVAVSASSISQADLLDCGVEGVLDQLRPVDSLDQLYCQSVALNPILISKVQSWAEYSGGCFCSLSKSTVERVDLGLMENGGSASENGCCDSEREVNALPAGFVRWKDVWKLEQRVGGQVQWAKVKSVQRSIEKSQRSYGKVCTEELVNTKVC